MQPVDAVLAQEGDQRIDVCAVAQVVLQQAAQACYGEDTGYNGGSYRGFWCDGNEDGPGADYDKDGRFERGGLWRNGLLHEDIMFDEETVLLAIIDRADEEQNIDRAADHDLANPEPADQRMGPSSDHECGSGMGQCNDQQVTDAQEEEVVAALRSAATTYTKA